MVVGELLPLANADNKGLMSISNYRRMGRNFTKGYRKLAESSVWYNHYGALIYAASPISTNGVMISISWRGSTFSATRINGSNNNVRLYTGDNPNTGNHELWLGMTGSDGAASELIIRNAANLDWNSTTVDSLPAYLSEISIS